MVRMDVISLDDTAGDGSLFVLDETPNMRIGPQGRKRKRVIKKKPQNYLVLGGSVSDASPIPTPRRRKKRKTVETIVIDDDDDDDASSDEVMEIRPETSVIEVSDDEKVGVIGGLLSGSFDRIQRKIFTFEKHREMTKRRKKMLPGNKGEVDRKDPAVKFGLGSHESVPFQLPHLRPDNTKKEPSRGMPRKLRPIVIDGSNVAFGHGNRTVFSSRGIEICCDYFRQRGHNVKVFMPQFRRRHPATADHHILDKLETEKVLVFTPSRRINGKTVASYDDRMMVEYAAKSGAVIVTRDNLQDLVSENDTFKQVINERILMFTWVDEEVIMFPQDPLGRKGPTLDEFLSFPPEETEK